MLSLLDSIVPVLIEEVATMKAKIVSIEASIKNNSTKLDQIIKIISEKYNGRGPCAIREMLPVKNQQEFTELDEKLKNQEGKRRMVGDCTSTVVYTSKNKRPV